jgi:hypothetical protein
VLNEHGITIPFPIRTLDFGIKGGIALGDGIDTLPGKSPGADSAAT